MTWMISSCLNVIDDREEHQHTLYSVLVDNYPIETVVTRTVSVATAWLRETNSIINNRSSDSNDEIVIGLVAQFYKCSIPDDQNFPITTIVLCLDDRCLIYQILHRGSFDRYDDLKRFLAGSDYTFVGVEGLGIIASLLLDFNWEVPRMVDLSELAKIQRKDELPEGGDVKKLAEVILNENIFEPFAVYIKDWHGKLPVVDQVLYTVYDAYLCYQIGLVTEAYRYDPVKI